MSRRNTEGEAESDELSHAHTSSADKVWTPERSTCHSAAGTVTSADAVGSAGVVRSADAAVAAFVWLAATTVSVVGAIAGSDGAVSTPEADPSTWLAGG